MSNGGYGDDDVLSGDSFRGSCARCAWLRSWRLVAWVTEVLMAILA